MAPGRNSKGGKEEEGKQKGKENIIMVEILHKVKEKRRSTNRKNTGRRNVRR